MGLYFHHQTHPTLSVISTLAQPLHSFWSFWLLPSALTQYYIGHLLTWGPYLPVSYLSAFWYCSWGSLGENTGMGCHSLLQGIFPTQGFNPGLLNCRQILYQLSHQGRAEQVKVLVVQSRPTLCFPMDCSLPDVSVHGILQTVILEWLAISFSRGSSWPRGWTRVSCIASEFFTIWTTREALKGFI